MIYTVECLVLKASFDLVFDFIFGRHHEGRSGGRDVPRAKTKLGDHPKKAGGHEGQFRIFECSCVF